MIELQPAPHFQSLEQQRDAARLGMWVFLASELLLFAGLFALYAAARAASPAGFREGTRHMAQALGATNTMLLLSSSFAVALGVHALERGRRRSALNMTLLTVGLGLLFLCIKGVEYSEHLSAGLTPSGGAGSAGKPAGFPLFVTLYYTMTGLHAFHVLAGCTLLSIMSLRLRSRAEPPLRATTLELGALYWHLVDLIWVFLWPLFYLTGGPH